MGYAVEIPYGGYWSTPFARWQGSLSHLHSLRFAAHVEWTAYLLSESNGPRRHRR
jgi:hypothetical protein